jgi:hypothetical protein
LKQQTVNRSDIVSKTLLFLLNPFLSAINSLKDIRDGVSHRFLYLWFLTFGIGFSALSEQADSFRYVEDFLVQANYSWSRYVGMVEEWLTFETDIKDIYTLTVNVFVGHFSHNYHWTYVIYATVFGFFYIKSLRVFLRNQLVSRNFVFYALLFMFCYSNPMFNINGVRFWTAAWIGVYVMLKFFVEKKYLPLLLLLLLPVVHGSSIIWVPIMLLAFLLQRFQSVTIVLYIASAFVSAVSYLNILNDYSDLLPQFMQNQIWSYTESDMALEKMAGKSEYGKAYADFLIALPGYFQILMCLLLILNRKLINADKTSGRLLSIMLALSAATNFLSGIPSLGRFKAFVIPLLVIVWARNHHVLKKYDKLFYILPIIYAYSLLYWYRHMNGVTELYLYILPAPITAIKYLVL